MTTYKEMLESEINSSERFTRDNFGLKIGDDFPEIVRELCQSETVSRRLLIGLLMGALLGKGITADLKSSDIGNAILNNVDAFETPLALFYWGVQVGRKSEREQSNTLAGIDGQHK
jgi:hypothetical protein